MTRLFFLAVLATALLPAAASACDGLFARGLAAAIVGRVADRPRLFRPLDRFAATERTTTVTRTSSTRTTPAVVVVAVPVAKVRVMPAAPVQAPAVKVAPIVRAKAPGCTCADCQCAATGKK